MKKRKEREEESIQEARLKSSAKGLTRGSNSWKLAIEKFTSFEFDDEKYSFYP